VEQVKVELQVEQEILLQLVRLKGIQVVLILLVVLQVEVEELLL
jgi:hypothetical protein